jgi:hypothetical protein
MPTVTASVAAASQPRLPLARADKGAAGVMVAETVMA